ncbi:MAG: CAP domain-containing protein [Verrucomicrobiia bacterium]
MKIIHAIFSTRIRLTALATDRASSVLWAACLGVLLPLCSPGQIVTTSGRTPQAPPTAPPVVVNHGISPAFQPPPPPEGITPYSIGSPTDEEQQYLEYINRARSNPPHEGWILATTTDPNVLAAYAYFGVDTNLLQTQFNAIAATPPVAMNAELLASARGHSGWMFANQCQSHYETNGSTILDPGDRISAQGYNWYTYGENIYAYSEYVFYGHAGFEVDWGPGTGGMQTPPGHRENIHNATFREVGVGVVDGTNGSVGPQLVTQDFATSQSAVPLITGVVYYDFNNNSFYDVGEGIGGVTVQVPGSTYFAITPSSGGYTVPVTTNGTYTIIFSASGLTNQTTVTVSNLYNVKVDYVPAYSPPVISGPNPAALTNNNTYSFTTVGAATNYQCAITQLTPYTAVEGAENGTNYVTIVSSPGYSVFASDVKASGNYSFHFCQPVATAQSLTFNATFLPHTNCQLVFSKRLGYATSTQIARAQISTNNGVAWQDVWDQAGSGGSGDASFSQITNSLAAFAGVSTKVRFLYDFTGGSYYPETSSGVGLYLDNIAITNADQSQPLATNNIPSGCSFVFYPTNTGNYLFSVCAQLPGRTLPWGPSLNVTVSNLPPMTVKFAGLLSRSGNQFQADFNVVNYRNGMSYQVLKTSDLSGNWTTDTLASIQTIIANTQFRITTTNSTNHVFYRIRAN